MIKTALVTGSAGGIGREIALELASRGFNVAFHYNKRGEEAKAASQQAATHGIKSIALQADITKPQEAKSLVETAAEKLGGLSVVVNNVGNYLEQQTSKISIEEWHQMLDSNLNATFYVTQATIPFLKTAGWGRIVNFACAGAQHLMAHETQTAYRIAKTGIIIYTKSLALELIKDKITANIISPGVAENSIGLEEAIPLLPAKQPATLKDISNAVGFLTDQQADYITGQVLEVAGGWRL
jgi:NAD(P)-dependent dehydrogenase (short-subunit alcohol dehydrogenase family)